MKTGRVTIMLAAVATLGLAFADAGAQERPAPKASHGQEERAGGERWQPDAPRPGQDRSSASFDAATPLREFPTDTFNERTIQMLEQAGIGTVGDLLGVDPRRLAQVLRMDPREVESAQRKIRESLR